MEKLKSILLISQFHQAFFHFWVFVLTIPFAGDIYYFLQFFGLKYLNLLRYSLNVMFLQGLSPVILPKMSSHSYSHIEVIVVVVQSPSVSNPETPWMQHHRPPCLSLSRRVCPSLCPLNRWCYPTISSSAALLLLPSVFCSVRIFSSDSALRSNQVAKVLELQLHLQSFQWIDFLLDWPIWSPCYPRDSQESSPELQFENIHSSALSLLYVTTLISVYNYWETMCTVLFLVTQLCLIFWDPSDCRPLGSSVHGDSPGKNTGVGCHALLQEIFPTQGSNPGLPHWGRFFTVWATREAQEKWSV